MPLILYRPSRILTFETGKENGKELELTTNPVQLETAGSGHIREEVAKGKVI